MTDPGDTKSFSVRLVPSGNEVSCRADQTLLDSCILAGIPVPYNCRSGECGECMAALISGQVEELPGADPAVFTNAHRDQGDLLMCMCFPRSSVVLNIPMEPQKATIRPSTFNVMVQQVSALSPTVYGVTVETPWPVDFHAGQNFEWILPNISRNRTYSAANCPGMDTIDFHVRVYPGGKVGEYVSNMSRGETFQMIGPFGHFGLSDNRWRPCICVAGGTGLAPVMSVLEHAFITGDRRPIKLMYGARTQEELYCSDQLRSWADAFSSFTIIPVLSHEPEDSNWDGKRGLVTEALANELSDIFGLEAYICGPSAMIDAAVAVLENAGLPREDIRTDRFVQAKP